MDPHFIGVTWSFQNASHRALQYVSIGDTATALSFLKQLKHHVEEMEVQRPVILGLRAQATKPNTAIFAYSYKTPPHPVCNLGSLGELHSSGAALLPLKI